MLLLQNIVKSYGFRPVVEDINISFPAGRTTVLLGPSGCGKSTLLRTLIGLVTADQGQVFLDDLELTPATLLAIRRRMGYVIQEGGLFPHLTAAGNINLLARYLKTEPQWLRSRVEELCELTQFPREGLNRYPVQLSGGQRQRVSLMRALVLDPDVLLLDEPLGALDPLIRSDLQEDLRRIFRLLRKTVVLVTHDLAEAAFFGDHLVLLRDGRVIQQGTLEDLLERPADAFVTRFVNAQRRPLHAVMGGRA